MTTVNPSSAQYGFPSEREGPRMTTNPDHSYTVQVRMDGSVVVIFAHGLTCQDCRVLYYGEPKPAA